MKQYTVRLTVKAEKDVSEIEHYFFNILKEPEAGLDLLQKLMDAAVSLETIPFRHSLANDDFLKALKIRSFPVGNYIIFYTVTDDKVFIARILHEKRELSGLFSEVI